MTTKAKSSATSRKSSAKGAKVSAKDLQTVVNSVSAVAPAGVGVTAGGAGAASVLPAVGAAAPAKVRQNGADQIAVAISENDLKLSELRAKIASRFAAPEWSGAAALRAALLPLVESGVMSSEQYDGALSAAARKAGVSVPVCSVPRVLAVIRQYRKEFENVCGCSFDSVRAYYQIAGAGAAVSFSLRLPLGSVRANSLKSDYIAAAAVPAGASASAIVAAVLSFRFLAAFRRSVAAAVTAARNGLHDSLANCWREAQRLGMSFEDVQNELREIAYYVSDKDTKQRKQLARNLEYAWRNINATNDAILLAGGAGGASVPAKVNKLLAARARFASVAATCSRLLS